MGGYIKHSDLAKILRRLGEKGGRQILYDKRSLLKAINVLNEYSKPQYTIDNREYIKTAIKKYRQDVLARKCKPYLYRFLENAMNIDSIEIYNVVNTHSLISITYEEAINIIPTSKMLGELLQVSKPTLSRWSKEGIMTPFDKLIEVYSIEGRNWTRKYKTEKRMFNLIDLENYIKSMDRYK